MSAEIIELRPDLTPEQQRRLTECLRSRSADPVRSADAHLVQDLARFAGKIRLMAFAAGARMPTGRKRIDHVDSGSSLDRVFQQIYDDANSLMFKAIDFDDAERR